jgi:DNA adenine methylase
MSKDHSSEILKLASTLRSGVFMDVLISDAEELVFSIKRIGAQLWGSSGGKSRIANRLIPMFPEHRTYVEVFAGGAAVFWAKTKEGSEVLNDMDSDISGAFTFIRDITPAQIAELKRMNWKVSLAHRKALRASKPSSPAARFHRMAMLRYSGFMCNPDGGIDPKQVGLTLRLIDRIPRAKERLAGVKIHGEDYRSVIKKYDGPDVFFFMDPPYTKTDQNLGERGFDHGEFWKTLGAMKGKFMVTYDVPDPGRKHNLKILEHAVTDGRGGSNRVYKTHVITNYKTKRVSKTDDLSMMQRAAAAVENARSVIVDDVLARAKATITTDTLAGGGKKQPKQAPFISGLLPDGKKKASSVEAPDGFDQYGDPFDGRDDDGVVIQKQVPQPGASTDDKRGAQLARAAKYKIEALEGAGERLTYPAGFPRDLKLYGDPVNLMFPLDPAGRARNARARFKQFADKTYEQTKSKAIVHERIVSRMLDQGMEPAFSADDPLDKLLPAGLRERLQKQEAMTIQTLILSKERFETLEEAKGWIKENDFKVTYEGKEPDETGTSWRFRQRDPGEFKPGSFRTVSLPGADGVQAVMGKLKVQTKLVCTDKAMHKNDRCMRCKAAPPAVECIWAEGRARAWFCQACWKEWSTRGDGKGDVDRWRKLTDGHVGSKYGDAPGSDNKTSKAETPKNFLEHAQQWVKDRGLLDGDSDYGGMLGRAVLRMAELFSKEGHSGMSALYARAYFNFVCDAWEGMHTWILNEKDNSKVKDLLAKMAAEQCEAIIKSYEEQADQQDDDEMLVRLLPVLKQQEEEQIVLGIVLEPGEVDTQKDTISEEEIYDAAHDWLAKYQNRGYMHRRLVNDKIEIFESYIAPADLTIGGQRVKKGSWLLMYHIKDKGMWAKIKRGELTGFSMGGFARRVRLQAAS